MHRRAAFSVLEMLVSLAILALLVALVLPALKGAREQSQRQRCVSNLRGIGVAIVQYAADHNGLVVYNVSAGNSGTWVGALLPYACPGQRGLVKDVRPPGVFACPSGSTLAVNGNESDYGKNLHINEQPEKTDRTVYRLSMLQTPGKVIAVGDAVYRGISPLYTNANLAPRHSGNANVLYFDGHVAAVLPRELPAKNNALPWVPQ